MKHIASVLFAVGCITALQFPGKTFAQSAGCDILLVSASNDSVVVKAEFYTPVGYSFRLEAIYVTLAYDPSTFRVRSNSIMNHQFASAGFQRDSDPFLDTNGVYPDLCIYGESHPNFGSIPYPANYRCRLCTFTFIPRISGPGNTSFLIYGNVTAPAYSGYWITTSFDNQVFSPANDLYTTWPVEWTVFNAVQQGDAVALRWTTASERGNSGFHVMRRPAGDEREEAWEAIGFVQGRGDSPSESHYLFLDRTIERDGWYQYRLRQEDVDGRSTWSSVATVEFRRAVAGFAIENAYPNPVSSWGTATFRYSLPERSRIRVTVSDILGREVAVLEEGAVDAGNYTATWKPAGLPAGRYLATLVAETAEAGLVVRKSVSVTVSP
ncbi:MAG: hypothetical protein QHI48_02735 [Bacteroidota bacterium]|nr:hypothetical protein [Bacteroidota bacterium]